MYATTMSRMKIHWQETLLRLVPMLAAMLMVLSAFPQTAEAGIITDEDYIGEFDGLDDPGDANDMVSVSPTAPGDFYDGPGDDIQLLKTKDDDQYVDIRAWYHYRANPDYNATYFEFSFFVYKKVDGRYIDGVALTMGSIVITDAGAGGSPEEGEGEILPVMDLEFNTEEVEGFKFWFSACMRSAEGQYYWDSGTGYGFTDPEESSSSA